MAPRDASFSLRSAQGPRIRDANKLRGSWLSFARSVHAGGSGMTRPMLSNLLHVLVAYVVEHRLQDCEYFVSVFVRLSILGRAV